MARSVGPKKPVAFGIFCDDVRQESNGKFLLIGCYGDTMVVSRFPYINNLTGLITAGPLGRDASVQISIRLKSGAEIGSITMMIQTQELVRLAQIPIPPIGINVSSEDVVELWFGIEGGSLTKIATLRITAGVVSSPPPGIFSNIAPQV